MLCALISFTAFGTTRLPVPVTEVSIRDVAPLSPRTDCLVDDAIEGALPGPAFGVAATEGERGVLPFLSVGLRAGEDRPGFPASAMAGGRDRLVLDPGRTVASPVGSISEDRSRCANLAFAALPVTCPADVRRCGYTAFDVENDLGY